MTRDGVTFGLTVAMYPTAAAHLVAAAGVDAGSQARRHRDAIDHIVVDARMSARRRRQPMSWLGNQVALGRDPLASSFGEGPHRGRIGQAADGPAGGWFGLGFGDARRASRSGVVATSSGGLGR